ncbi:MAG: ATP-binding protein [Terracidiphilus sp.]
MKSRSLVRRATLAVLGIELLCAVGLAATAILHEREVRLRALDVALKGRSDSLIGAVQDAEDPQDNVMVDPEEFSAGPGDEFAVYNPDGRVVGTSQGDLSAVATQEKDGFHNLQAHAHDYRVFQRKALRIIDRPETGGVGIRRPVIVVYAVRRDHVWHEVLEATRFYILLSLGSVFVTAFLLIVLARRLLSPLKELASAASSIEPATLQFSPPASALTTNELAPLAKALSEFVVRLRQAFAMERRFISDAAHELKTAVAVVRSTIQVLGMKPRSQEEYQGGLDRILEDNQRVEELVARMLTLARFEARDAMPGEAIDLGEESRIALANLTSYAEWRGVSLVAAGGGEVRVRVTPEAVQTLVSNLVMNAVQHSSRGSEVRVNVHGDENRSRKATLTVQDSGEGISPENLHRVFERFFREDPSRSRETGGAGLGLSICKSIVEGAGGSIEIESEKGKGTVVRVQFDALD